MARLVQCVGSGRFEGASAEINHHLDELPVACGLLVGYGSGSSSDKESAIARCCSRRVYIQSASVPVGNFE